MTHDPWVEDPGITMRTLEYMICEPLSEARARAHRTKTHLVTLVLLVTPSSFVTMIRRFPRSLKLYRFAKLGVLGRDPPGPMRGRMGSPRQFRTAFELVPA